MSELPACRRHADRGGGRWLAGPWAAHDVTRHGLALLDTRLRAAITARLWAAASHLLDRCALGRITIDRPDPD